jgi:hypothetical protein
VATLRLVSPTGRRPTVVRLAALRTSRRLRRGWRVSTVVSCSSHPLLKLAELRESVSVLRSVGELFHISYAHVSIMPRIFSTVVFPLSGHVLSSESLDRQRISTAVPLSG